MAKLKDLTEWITDTLRGDAARTRSLIQVGRKNGLFSVGGRGSGSPDMTSNDAAVATLISLYDGPPTLCAEAMEEFISLPVWSVDIAPNGPREDERILLYHDDVHKKRLPLPSVFPELPLNPLEALRDIFSADEPSYHLDCVFLELGGWGPRISLVVHDVYKPIESDLESETDLFQFSITYGLPIKSPNRGRAKHTTHQLDGEQLQELFCLITGYVEEEFSST